MKISVIHTLVALSAFGLVSCMSVSDIPAPKQAFIGGTQKVIVGPNHELEAPYRKHDVLPFLRSHGFTVTENSAKRIVGKKTFSPPVVTSGGMSVSVETLRFELDPAVVGAGNVGVGVNLKE